jgi:hypothetical protein
VTAFGRAFIGKDQPSGKRPRDIFYRHGSIVKVSGIFRFSSGLPESCVYEVIYNLFSKCFFPINTSPPRTRRSLVVHLIFDILYVIPADIGGMKRRNQNYGKSEKESCNQNYGQEKSGL